MWYLFHLPRSARIDAPGVRTNETIAYDFMPLFSIDNRNSSTDIFSPRLDRRLIAGWKEIAYGHDEEGAHMEALSICAKNKLDSSVSIREAIKSKLKADKENFDVYQENLSLLWKRKN